MKIENTAALVSGGASGMGEAVVRRLAEQGARVSLLDRDASRAERIANETGSLALTCDVTDESSLVNALAAAQNAHGVARICVNCAGIVQAKRMVGRDGVSPLREFEYMLRVNLTGTFALMRLAAAAMSTISPDEEGQRGIVINTASIAAFEGQIGQVAYSASKGGIVAMTLPAARELARFGIRVMAIAPGLVDTPMLASLAPAARQQLSESVPFPKRPGKPAEFAALVQHIIENDMLNGTVIRLDGALRMGA